MQQTGTGIKQVGRVVVPVSDQARARAFYVETLGFEVRGEFVMSPEYTWLEVAPVGAVTTLAIVPPPEGKPDRRRHRHRVRDARHRGRPRGA